MSILTYLFIAISAIATTINTLASWLLTNVLLVLPETHNPVLWIVLCLCLALIVGAIFAYAHWKHADNQPRMLRIIDTCSYGLAIIGLFTSIIALDQYSTRLRIQNIFTSSFNEATSALKEAKNRYELVCASEILNPITTTTMSVECLQFNDMLNYIDHELKLRNFQSQGRGDFSIIEIDEIELRNSALQNELFSLHQAIETKQRDAHISAYALMAPLNKTDSIYNQMRWLDISIVTLVMAFGMGLVRRLLDVRMK